MNLAQLERTSDVLTVRSKLLGEEILIAGNLARVPKSEKRTVYSVQETNLLHQREPEQVQKIHLVKQIFDGALIQ